MKKWATIELNAEPLKGMTAAAKALGRADAFDRVKREMARTSGSAASYCEELQRRLGGGLGSYMAWLYAETDFPNCGRVSSGKGRSASALFRALSDCARNGDDDDCAMWSAQAARIMEVYQAVGDYEETRCLLDCLSSGSFSPSSSFGELMIKEVG